MNDFEPVAPRGRYLQAGPLFAFLFAIFAIYVPLTYWFSWNNPALFDLRGHGHPATWAVMLNTIVLVMLFTSALGWMMGGRMIDWLGIQLLIHGMILVNYYILPSTATGVGGVAKTILYAGEQMVAINAVGFFTLIICLGGTYAYYALAQMRLKPLRDAPERLDHRLHLLLLPALVVVTGMIALPIVLTGQIPMFSSDPVAAREALEESDLGRLFYNFGSSLLPSVVAGNLILALRRPGLLGRFLSFEVALTAIALSIQILTSNRLPLALTFVMFLALWSMERPRPRWVLFGGVLIFLGLFLGLSGFTSILRQSRDLLQDENIVSTAFTQAFLGNNLSDLRDGAWVMGAWDFVPLNGKTYLGGLAAVLPSAIFPAKKELYLGLVALEIAGWAPENHFGLRISFFGEAFLNFGLAGVIGLGVLIGCIGGYLLRKLHLAAAAPVPCLTRNLVTMLSLQLTLVLSESSQGFVFYAISLFLLSVWLVVYRPFRFTLHTSSVPAPYSP